MKISGQADRVLAPGATERFTVTISTNNLSGELSKGVTVNTNDPDHRRETLRCLTKVLAPFRSDPTYVAFGRIERTESERSTTVSLLRGDGGPLRIEVVRTSEPDVVRAVARELVPGERYAVDITLSAPWPKGIRRGWVRIRTGVEQAPETTIPFTYDLPPYAQAQPPQIAVPATVPTARTEEIRVTWYDQRPRPIKGARVTDAQLSVEVKDLPAGGQVVVLSIPANFVRQGGPRADVVIDIDDPGFPALHVPVTFAGKLPERGQQPRIQRVPAPSTGSQAGPTPTSSGAASPSQAPPPATPARP
ncbi:MAG TPA: hypothetical protein PKK06_04605 [Phycisphaerae bacterium]|nr:hypothetical protein [Phycisphaerae bacterium]HNU45120.1 hypothetical protein [Phycisphaerae bacterium]